MVLWFGVLGGSLVLVQSIMVSELGEPWDVTSRPDVVRLVQVMADGILKSQRQSLEGRPGMVTRFLMSRIKGLVSGP